MTQRVNREERTLEFERTLSCNPETAFDAWTDPKQVSMWWDPTGTALVSCAIDLRPAGAFRFETAGHAPPFEGIYRHVERPRRLEFDAMGASGTVTFTAAGEQTQMRLTIRSPSQEHFEMFLKMGVDQGTARTLDNLVAHVGRHPRSDPAPGRVS